MRPGYDISAISKRYSLPRNFRIMEIHVVVLTFRNLGINHDLYFKPRKGTIRAALGPPGYYTAAAALHTWRAGGAP